MQCCVCQRMTCLHRLITLTACAVAHSRTHAHSPSPSRTNKVKHCELFGLPVLCDYTLVKTASLPVRPVELDISPLRRVAYLTSAFAAVRHGRRYCNMHIHVSGRFTVKVVLLYLADPCRCYESWFWMCMCWELFGDTPFQHYRPVLSATPA